MLLQLLLLLLLLLYVVVVVVVVVVVAAAAVVDAVAAAAASFIIFSQYGKRVEVILMQFYSERFRMYSILLVLVCVCMYVCLFVPRVCHFLSLSSLVLSNGREID